MKIIALLVLLLLPITGTMAQIRYAMTFNLRYASPNDGENVWKKRKETVVDLLKKIQS